MDQVLRARGGKAVDLRAAGITVRFELGSATPTAAGAASSERSTAAQEASRRRAQRQARKTVENSVKIEFEAVMGTVHGVTHAAGASAADAAVTPDGPSGPIAPDGCNCFQLSIGCCVYQKGKYLLRHVEGGDSEARDGATTATRATSSNLPYVWELSGKENDGVGVEIGVLDNRHPVCDGEADVAAPNLRRAGSASSGLRRKMPETHATDNWHWGGGPGPRPCQEAVVVIKSLRLPLSDPHYFRVDDLAVELGTYTTRSGGEFVGRTQVLGGGEDPDRGWAGELLVTRCAVLGNPRQPGTRADAMLSRIRVEVRLVS